MGVRQPTLPLRVTVTGSEQQGAPGLRMNIEREWAKLASWYFVLFFCFFYLLGTLPNRND